MKGMNVDKDNDPSEAYEKKIEENISSMLQKVMNYDSSEEDNESNLEIEKSNMEIISFESSFLSEDNTNLLLDKIQKSDLNELKIEEKNFEKEIFGTFQQDEFNAMKKARGISGIKKDYSENKSHNISIAEDINIIPFTKKSFFFSQEKKKEIENFFLPRNFDNSQKNFSFSSQFSSQRSQDASNFSQDQILSFDFDRDREREKSITMSEGVHSSLFNKKIFKTQKPNPYQINQIYSQLLKTNFTNKPNTNKNLSFSSIGKKFSYNNSREDSTSSSSLKK